MGDTDGQVVVTIYSAAGQYMMQKVVVLTNGQAVVPMNELATGIYIIRMQDERGNVCNQKMGVR